MDPESFEPGPLAAVNSHASDDGWTLVFRRDLPHPPAKVWAALTEPDQLRQWSPYAADRDLGSVGDVTLTMFDGDTLVEPEGGNLPASVTRAQPPTLLEYTWGPDLLRWELAATGTGTHLILRHTLKDREWLPKVAAGWHLCLVVAVHLLDGRPIGSIRGMDAMNYGWERLNEAYAERLGITGDGQPPA
jgi:uncharacterized protein YndB with AHSA1/START domain